MCIRDSHLNKFKRKLIEELLGLQKNDLIDREKLEDHESERGSNNEMDSNKSRSADSLSMLSKTLSAMPVKHCHL